MPSLEVRGKEQLTRVADVLSGHAEAKTIRRRVSKVIRGEADGITRDQRAGLAAKMPHHGGLAGALSSEGRFSVRTALAGRGVGVTIVDSWKGHDIKAIDEGSVRHPLYGNRRYWFTQRVPARVLTNAFMKRRVRVLAGMVRQLDVLAEEIARET